MQCLNGFLICLYCILCSKLDLIFGSVLPKRAMDGFQFNFDLKIFMCLVLLQNIYIFFFIILYLKVLQLQNNDFCYPKDFAPNKMLCMH